MLNKYFFKLFLSVFILSSITLSCNSGGTSEVTIRIDLGLNNQQASNASESSVIDRVFRFFTKNIEAAPAPGNITELILHITGPDIPNLTKAFPAPIPDAITIKVPSGEARHFELLAHTPSATLRGIATRNLAPGAIVHIPIQMMFYQTKIVIPDFLNSRIVQIDNIDGDGWIASDNVTINRHGLTIASLQPYEIDFDNQGRIYVLNYYDAAPDIFRINDITSTTYTSIIGVVGASYTAFAIDRKNDLLYYTAASQIIRATLNGTVLKNDFTMTGISSIRGINITSNGILIIAHGNYFTSYDPNTGNGIIINSLQYTGGSTPFTYDIIEKGQKIYGAFNEDAMSSLFFIRDYSLNSNNELVESGGIYTTPLYGARKFIENFTPRIYFINEYSTNNTFSVIDDISGAGRDDFGTNGTGIGQFRFYQN